MNKEEITKKFHALEESKSEFLEQMRQIPTHNWHQQPEDNSWSAVQVIEHLLSSEGGTLAYMMKKTSGGWESLEITGDEQKANSAKLNTRLSSDEKYAAPSILPPPANSMTAEEIEPKWATLRMKLRNFVDAIGPDHYDRLLFKQPAAGMLNISQTLDFLNLHLRHHIPQIERIAAATK